MRVSIFGAGYVGVVSSACLASAGHQVIAVDPNEEKINIVNQGRSPIVEEGLEELLLDAHQRGALRGSHDVGEAIANSDLSFVCVGTPSRANGSLDTQYVQKVCEEIGQQLAWKSDFHSVVIRSTVLPNTMRDLVIPTLEQASGKAAGTDFGIAFYPEFLREGTAIEDYFRPEISVFGVRDDITLTRLRELTSAVSAKEIATEIEIAEGVKYACNCWHAVKISFANEVGNVFKSADVDSHKVMEILCMDRRLNISPAYLRPGYAFGGSCLPKDLRAIRYLAKQNDVSTPLLSATLLANQQQVDRAFDMIAHQGLRKVGMLGLSFKAGTDDLRESPLVELAERLLGKGYDLRIFDRNVDVSALIGSNLKFVQSRLQHLSSLMQDDLDEIIDRSDVIIVGNGDAGFRDVPSRLRPDQKLIDLVRVDAQRVSDEQYHGICW